MKTINEEVNRRINDRLARLADHAPDMLAMLERVAGLLADPDADGFDADRVEADILELLAKIRNS